MKNKAVALIPFLYSVTCGFAYSAVEASSPSLYSAIQGDVGIDLLINILAGAGGGLSHAVFNLKSVSGVVKNWKLLVFSDLLVSAFASAIVFALTESKDIDPFVQFALCGLSGWIGGGVLDVLSKNYFKTGDIK